MNTMWKVVVLLSIVCSILPLYMADILLSESIDGSLKHSWIINVTLYVKEFNGNILNCKDKQDNNLTIFVQEHKMLTVKYNHYSDHKYLLQLCGCIDCNDRKIRILIIRRHHGITLDCNGSGRIILRIKDTENGAMPPDIINKITISLGNQLKKVTDFHLFRLSGCVKRFFFNETKIMFFEQCPRHSTTVKLTTLSNVNPTSSLSSIDGILSTRTSLVSVSPGRKLETTSQSHTESIKIITNATVTMKMVSQEISSMSSVNIYNLSTENIQPCCNIFLWKMVVPGQFIIILIFVTLLTLKHQESMKAWLIKNTRNSWRVESAVIESIPYTERSSIYSPLNEFEPDIGIQQSQGSDNSRKALRLVTLRENMPSLNPRKRCAIYDRVDITITDSDYQRISNIIIHSDEAVKARKDNVIASYNSTFTEEIPELPPRYSDTVYKSYC